MSHLSYLCLCCLIISDFQQKYVVLKAMRRFGGMYIKNFINEKIEIKSVHFISNKSLCSKSNLQLRFSNPKYSGSTLINWPNLKI